MRSREREAARRLRAEGLTYREIGERLGVKRGTVAQWCLDPDGSQLRARKARLYQSACPSCGRSTNTHSPRRTTRLCRECRDWSDDAIITSIQRWAAEHDGIPPTSAQWRVASDDHPAASVVNKRRSLGGWNGALLEAGLPLHQDRRPETQREIERLVADGRTLREVGDMFGMTCGAISMRLRTRGLSVRGLRGSQFRGKDAP